MHTFCKKYITYLNEWFVKKKENRLLEIIKLICECNEIQRENTSFNNLPHHSDGEIFLSDR